MVWPVLLQVINWRVTYEGTEVTVLDRFARGRHLGIIKSGDYVFHIYEVKGDPERNYLYWEWKGEMYVRKEIAGAAK